MNEREAYDWGKDCAINGANKVNCNFKIFSSPELTKAWESGKKENKISKLKGCRVLLAKMNGKSICCGEIMLGKVRYCIRCNLGHDSETEKK